jgi:nucleotide-binding universal stress UspA family protein
MKRILVAVDGSSAALKAVDLAADLANKYSAELILLTVVPHLSPGIDPSLAEYARVEHIQVPATELALAAAESMLDGARRAARAKGATAIAAEPAFGDPTQEIIAAAGDRRADLIVVGSPGPWPGRRSPPRQRRAEGGQPRSLPGRRRPLISAVKSAPTGRSPRRGDRARYR